MKINWYLLALNFNEKLTTMLLKYPKAIAQFRGYEVTVYIKRKLTQRCTFQSSFSQELNDR